MKMNYVSAAEAVQLIKSHDKVLIQGSTSIPEVLLDALAARGHELQGVEIYSGFAVARREAPYATTALRDAFIPKSIFISNSIRKAVDRGEAELIPCFLGEVPALFREGIIPLDVVLLNVSLPNEEGYCSFGISADLATSGVECARTIIAQVNKQMPFTYGDALVHVSRIAACVEVDDPLVEVPTPVSSEAEIKIGNYIAEQIPDGATLQIGVGGIPNAVLRALSDHKDLGLHTEAMTDGVLPLIKSGVINNSQKVILPGKSVASLVLGSRALYDYLDYNPDVLIKDVAWTNDPFIIRQNPKVMSINSAIEVDLTGQICADSIGTRIFSGVGGQHDFMYGGALSEGGKTFIAMTSLSSKGISKIKSVLTEGAGVVTTRPQAQYIVTEYGAAYLKGKTLAERARALIAIAHPSVREQLERDACQRFGYRFLRMK